MEVNKRRRPRVRKTCLSSAAPFCVYRKKSCWRKCPVITHMLIWSDDENAVCAAHIFFPPIFSDCLHRQLSSRPHLSGSCIQIVHNSVMLQAHPSVYNKSITHRRIRFSFQIIDRPFVVVDACMCSTESKFISKGESLPSKLLVVLINNLEQLE